MLCFDLALQAGDAIHIEAPGLLNASGLITLLAPDGTVAVSHGYGFQIGAFLLDTGVAQSGTWQVQISNNGTTAGTLGSLSFSRLAIDGTIDLGGSANFTGTDTHLSRHYLVRPGAATAVAYKLSVRQRRCSAPRVSPDGRDDRRDRVTTGRVLAHPPLLLPIVAVQGQPERGDRLHPERDRPRGPAARRRSRHHLGGRRRRPHLADRRRGRSAMEHGTGIDALGDSS